jgi:hypothetical protein
MRKKGISTKEKTVKETHLPTGTSPPQKEVGPRSYLEEGIPLK